MEVREQTGLPEEPEWEWRVARLFPPRGKWTEADYLSLPDNRGVELSDGFLEFLPVPTEEHQLSVGYLYRTLFEFVETRKPGLVLVAGIPVRLWDRKLREPDVVFLRRENAGRRQGRFWDGADLVMEVVSREGRARDLREKRAEYARGGIPEYWIVDPEERRIDILVLDGETYRVHAGCREGEAAVSASLPGFSVEVTSVFAAGEVARE